MTRAKKTTTTLSSAVIVLAWCLPVCGQTIIDGGTADDNAASAGARAPGDLVTAGLGRAQQAAQDGRAAVQITQTADDTVGPRQQAMMNTAQFLSDLINQLLFSILNQLLSIFGIEPLTLDGILPSLTPPDDTAGATDGSGMTDGALDPVGGGTVNDTTVPDNGTTDPAGTTDDSGPANIDPSDEVNDSNDRSEADDRSGGGAGRRPARKEALP